MRSKRVRRIGLLIGILTENVWHGVRRRFGPTSEPFFWLDAEAREAAVEWDALARERRNS